MSTPIRILFIHGIGFQEEQKQWQHEWTAAATHGLRLVNPDAEVQASFFDYDQMFIEHDSSALEQAAAIGKMLGSYLAGKMSALFGKPRDLAHEWDARPGMVAEWAADAKLRKALRERLHAAVRDLRPQVIAAHSMGTLISYDWLRKLAGDTANEITYLTFGCQISCPALSPIFGGQVIKPNVKQWINLWNRQDHVFVESIRINQDGFQEVSLDRAYGHSGVGYLSDSKTDNTAWNQIALTYVPPSGITRAFLRRAVSADAMAGSNDSIDRLVAKRLHKRASRKTKALLIGINEYANPANNLEGCVNDVYRVSATLQECGFDPDDIRIVLNDRATAGGIKERIEWLLDGACGDDTRFLFYSGHGAQMPSYGGDEIPERVDECLVPHDFNWTEDTAIVDDWFYEVYHNLPYTVHFATMFDCCHAGGMAREGGAKVRGLTPPDDIRHRALAWDAKFQMWVPRKRFRAAQDKEERGKELVCNTDVVTTRDLGSGQIGRSHSHAKKPSHAKTNIDPTTPYGPYQPLLLKACSKRQLAREYRHGAESYGAFTFCITRLLQKLGKGVTFNELMAATAKQLHTLGYTQKPSIEGPSLRCQQPVPWLGDQPKSEKAARKRTAR